MPRASTVNQVVSKWQQNGQNSAETVRAGVNAVTESPTEKAAAAKDRWLAGVQRAAQNGTYENRLRQVTLAQWKQAMIEKGIPNMQNGYTKGQQKFQRFMQEYLPYIRQAAQQVRMMPKGNLTQAIDRVRAICEASIQFKMQRMQAPIAPAPRPL